MVNNKQTGIIPAEGECELEEQKENSTTILKSQMEGLVLANNTRKLILQGPAIMNTNDSQTYSNSNFHNSVEWYVYTALLGVNIVLNVTLNTVGLIVLHRVRNIQATTKVFLRSLTLSDLSMALFYALPSMLRSLLPQMDTGTAYCTFQVVSGIMLFHVNILSLLLLTIDRYISIVHCLRYPSIMTIPRARTMVCVLWTLLVTYSLTYVLVSPPKYSEEAHLCRIKQDSVNFSITIVIILVSVVTILALYTHIVIIAHRHKKRIAQDIPSSHPPSPGVRFNTKSLLTFCIIIMSLTVCWLPEVIALMVAKTTCQYEFLRWTFILQNASCWLNMVIYYLRNKDFRQTANTIVSSYLRSCKHCKSTVDRLG